MITWTEHVARWRDCTKCPLCKQRSNIVLARGTVPCDVLFIGEAPGASEDALGLPFKGPAGHLLDQIIDRVMDFDEGGHPRWTYALTNLVACFPRDAKMRGDNEPDLKEIDACRPRLEEFIRIASPKLVVCVGTLAWNCVEHDAYGRVMGAHVVQIVHPAHILARLPQVQKQYAVDKSILTIRDAVEDVILKESR